MTSVDLKHPIMGCICTEGHIIKPDGTVIFMPPVHDCAYIQKRHTFIGAAEAEATRLVRSHHSHWCKEHKPEAHPGPRSSWPR